VTPDYGTASSHGTSEAPFADLHVAMGLMAVNQLPVCLLMLAAIPAGPVASHAAAAAAAPVTVSSSSCFTRTRTDQ
jgi:hypothetical protein